ncbi:hypothetical protein V6N13_028048 [Hibiscus sabdariffa]
MDIKEWVCLNLSDAARVVSNPDNRDLLFGAICWNLWLERNAIMFKNPLEDRGTVLHRSRRLQQRCVLALSTAGLPSLQGGRIVSDTLPAIVQQLQQILTAGWFRANSDAGCRLDDGIV